MHSAFFRHRVGRSHGKTTKVSGRDGNAPVFTRQDTAGRPGQYGRSSVVFSDERDRPSLTGRYSNGAGEVNNSTARMHLESAMHV